MSDEDALLAAIQASPNDATVRLVYADWLEDHGDGRAEFLHLQLQLATVLDRLQHLRSDLDPAWVQTVQIRRDLVVHEIPAERRPAVLKLVRLNSGIGLEEARELLARLPARVLRELPIEQAERLREEFAKVAEVTMNQRTFSGERHFPAGGVTPNFCANGASASRMPG